MYDSYSGGHSAIKTCGRRDKRRRREEGQAVRGGAAVLCSGWLLAKAESGILQRAGAFS